MYTYALLTAMHTTNAINNTPKPPNTVQVDYIHDLYQFSINEKLPTADSKMKTKHK